MLPPTGCSQQHTRGRHNLSKSGISQECLKMQPDRGDSNLGEEFIHTENPAAKDIGRPGLPGRNTWNAGCIQQ